MVCEFSEPMNLGSTTESWAFSKLECDNPSTTELIINSDYPEREFFVEKTLSYGDALIIFLLTLFLVGIIVKGIFNFFWKI
jgi:hypothetical protein